MIFSWKRNKNSPRGTLAEDDLFFSQTILNYNPHAQDLRPVSYTHLDVYKRQELEWLLKMQNGWGGVYDKVITAQFPDFIMPDQDQAPLYIMQEMTTSTGAFVGAMALAYSIYQDIDPEFARRCLDAAKLSWDYLQSATLLSLIHI